MPLEFRTKNYSNKKRKGCQSVQAFSTGYPSIYQTISSTAVQIQDV
jgi:hypothetical protein